MDSVIHLTPVELALRWRMTDKDGKPQTGTLKNWRSTGDGPRYVKLGRRVLYPLPEVEAHERAHLHAAASVVVKGDA